MKYSGELKVSELAPAWREQDGVIHFSVTSDGKTGPEWIAYLESKGNYVGDYAKQLLCFDDFQPTSGVVYEIAVLKGMITKKIRANANEHQLITPNVEIACLIRDKFADQEIKDMGLLRIITMHKPIWDSDGCPRLFCVYCFEDCDWLGADYNNFSYRWNRDSGFAFITSQVSSQS